MTTFKYKGISKEGADVNGIVRAYDEFEAVAKLREACAVVTKIEKVLEQEEAAAQKQRVKIKDKDLAMMCSQFSIILAAGLPVVKCVEMVADQCSDKALRERMQLVADDIAGGYTMAQSFKEHLPDLPATFVETVRAGEASGALVACFKRLHKYFEDSAKTKGKVSSTLMYPLMVICVAIVVFIIIMTVAVPTFTNVFSELGEDLPFITKAMMATSDFFLESWWVLLLIAAVIGLIYLLVRRTEKGKRWIAEFLLMKSPLGRIRILNCANTFASTLSTMISSGLSIVRALEIASAVADNYIFSLAVFQVKQDVEQGKGIAESMRNDPCFPKLLTEMTGVGERTGSMEQTLDIIADYYSSEVQIQTTRLIGIMEPAITIGLAIMTVVLLLGLYLPMFSMYGAM